MKKRVMGIALVLVLAMSVVLTGCGKKGDAHSETYTGTVSAQTYATSEDAAVAFVNEEIAGAAVEVSNIECSEPEELTEDEQAKLTISEEDKAGLTKVERITVTYTETVVEEDETEPAPSPLGYEQNELYNAAASDAEETKKKTRVVLVLVYVNGECRYFAPVVLKGEQLTASYFNSAFDPELYVNSTLTQNMTVNMKINMAGQNQSQKSKVKSTAKFTDETVYFSQSGAGVSMEMYMTEQNGVVKGAANMSMPGYGSSGWIAEDDIFEEVAGAIGGGEIYSLNDFALNYFDMCFGSMDHTCFEKTDTGYALRKGMGKQFILSTMEQYMDGLTDELGPILGSSDISVRDIINLYKYDLEYEIIINKGLVSKLYIDMNMSLDMTDFMTALGAPADVIASVAGTISVSSKGTCTLSDIGTTKISIPSKVSALF